MQKLESFAQDKHWDISVILEELTVKYLSSIPLHQIDSLEETYRSSLLSSRKRDLFKNTGVGPHRRMILLFLSTRWMPTLAVKVIAVLFYH